jgi:predicted O-methyltransferase YrrM
MAKPLDIISRIFGVDTSEALPICTKQRFGDRHLLAKACAELGYKRGVEIGVRTGAFSEVFLKAGMEMWCVDPWSPAPNYSLDRQERNYAECVRRLAPYQAHLVRKPSQEALGDVPDGLDFLHIDGRHEFDYAVLDLVQWCPKVRPGGLITMHDYHLSGVKHAIDAYTQAHRITPWFVLKNVQPTAFWIQP